MYTLLKAVTAMQLARRVATSTASRRSPCSGSTPKITTGTRSRELYGARRRASSRAPSRWRAPEGAGHLPVAALTLDERIDAASPSSRAALPPTEFTDWADLVAARAPTGPGVGMADAFARWLEALLGPYGLVVFESADPAAKPLAADVFARELQTPGQHRLAGRRRGRTCSRRSVTRRRSSRSPTAFRSSTSNGDRQPIRRRATTR